MSVIVRKLPSVNARNLKVFTKGAPEMIKKLSRPESIPKDFDMVLGSLTSKGYRVLAMAYRDIRKDFHQAMKLERYMYMYIYIYIFNYIYLFLIFFQG